MLRLFGANPAAGVLLGGALLGVGLLAHRPLLAVAGGFVGLVSLFRHLSGAKGRRDDQTGSRRGPGPRL